MSVSGGHRTSRPRSGPVTGDGRDGDEATGEGGVPPTCERSSGSGANALKFTPEGGRIDVRAAVSEGMVEVSVADTGVGIAPEDQEAVFEEFRQVGTADKKV